jgi:hypothetical protein
MAFEWSALRQFVCAHVACLAAMRKRIRHLDVWASVVLTLFLIVGFLDVRSCADTLKPLRLACVVVTVGSAQTLAAGLVSL